MNATVSDVLELLESLAPPSLAESWDNVGLQVGDRSRRVRSVWVSLDPLPEVVDEACRAGVDLLVTHHPLLFRPLSVVDVETPIGRILQEALTHGLSVAAAHTNLDSASGGLNDLLAQKLQLVHLRPLVPAEPGPSGRSGAGDEGIVPAGMGRVGNLTAEMPLAELVRRVKGALGLAAVRWVGDGTRKVTTVAVCSGSGSGLLEAFYRSAAEVFISGDLRYHDARDAQASGRALIDVGHFPSEHLVVGALADRLADGAAERGWDLQVTACDLETDPFVMA